MYFLLAPGRDGRQMTDSGRDKVRGGERQMSVRDIEIRKTQ